MYVARGYSVYSSGVSSTSTLKKPNKIRGFRAAKKSNILNILNIFK